MNDSNSPWLEHDDWSRVLRSDARKKMWAMWGFATVWMLISLPASVAATGELRPGNYIVAVTYLFPVIGVWLGVVACRATVQWRRYGVTELTLDPYPGSVGGQVGGYIALATGVAAGRTFEVTLECVHSYVSGSGKNRSRKEKIVWQARGPAALRPQGGQTQVAFCFDVPGDLPVSERPASSYHLWRLSLVSNHEKHPLDRTFELPVFATAEASRYVSTNTLALGRAAAERLIEDALLDPRASAELRRRSGLTVEVRDQWIRLFFHYGRQKALAAGLFLVGAPFVAVGFFLPGDGFADILMRIVFPVVGGIMVAASCYIPFNTLDVRISKQKMERIRTWCGLTVARTSIVPAALSSLDIAQGSSTRSGSRSTIYYRLTGKSASGDFRIAEGIANRQFLEVLRDRVLTFAGLESAQ